jgi:nucleoid DNA-binding protein
MRLVVVCLLIAACEQAPASRQAPPAPPSMPTTKTPLASTDLARLASELQRLSPNDTMYLAELGWFAKRVYESYEGRNPRTGARVFVPKKTLLFFRPHPNLRHVINGEPPETVADPLHYWDDDTSTHHAAWADELAASTKRQLLERGRVELVGVGTLEVGASGAVRDDEKPDDEPSPGKSVRWETDAALELALQR